VGPPVAVAGWVWTITTVVGAVLSVTLLGILAADVLTSAISSAEARDEPRPAKRLRPDRITITLAVSFLAVVSARFVLILVRHHGP
jgi:hypothetical protein